MTQEVAYRFIQALSALEEDGEVEPIVSTFTDHCEIGTPAIPVKLHGKEQARDFWNSYRTAYRQIRSTFRNIVIGDNSIALEWTAQKSALKGSTRTTRLKSPARDIRLSWMARTTSSPSR